jgi:phage tail protein X
MAEAFAPARLGVMLDELAFEARDSDANGIVEATLGLNPGLANALRADGHALALDRAVTLPEIPARTRTVPQIKLWD